MATNVTERRLALKARVHLLYIHARCCVETIHLKGELTYFHRHAV